MFFYEELMRNHDARENSLNHLTFSLGNLFYFSCPKRACTCSHGLMQYSYNKLVIMELL